MKTTSFLSLLTMLSTFLTMSELLSISLKDSLLKEQTSCSLPNSTNFLPWVTMQELPGLPKMHQVLYWETKIQSISWNLYLLLEVLNLLLCISQHCLNLPNLTKLNQLNLPNQFYNNKNSRFLKIGSNKISLLSLLNWVIWLTNIILSLLFQYIWDLMLQILMIRFYKD